MDMAMMLALHREPPTLWFVIGLNKCGGRGGKKAHG
jgi:hypothetical protein